MSGCPWVTPWTNAVQVLPVLGMLVLLLLTGLFGVFDSHIPDRDIKGMFVVGAVALGPLTGLLLLWKESLWGFWISVGFDCSATALAGAGCIHSLWFDVGPLNPSRWTDLRLDMSLAALFGLPFASLIIDFIHRNNDNLYVEAAPSVSPLESGTE